MCLRIFYTAQCMVRLQFVPTCVASSGRLCHIIHNVLKTPTRCVQNCAQAYRTQKGECDYFFNSKTKIVGGIPVWPLNIKLEEIQII
jgi:hypothetical protein